MRAGMASIPGEEAAIGAEGRALVDWNKRNVVSRDAGASGARTDELVGIVLSCVLEADALGLGGVEACLHSWRALGGGTRCSSALHLQARSTSDTASFDYELTFLCAQVHNFNYPRTDPVVIMAIVSPDREQILLGRQVRRLAATALIQH